MGKKHPECICLLHRIYMVLILFLMSILFGIFLLHHKRFGHLCMVYVKNNGFLIFTVCMEHTHTLSQHSLLLCVELTILQDRSERDDLLRTYIHDIYIYFYREYVCMYRHEEIDIYLGKKKDYRRDIYSPSPCILYYNGSLDIL